ncbi:hypothetical protein ACVME8_008814 [Bradyrhizobium diazoefficiens]
MTGKQLFGLALICLVVVTAEALSLWDEHIREQLVAQPGLPAFVTPRS